MFEPGTSSGVRLYFYDNYTVPASTAAFIIAEASQPYDQTVVFEPDRGTLLEKGITLLVSLVTLY